MRSARVAYLKVLIGAFCTNRVLFSESENREPENWRAITFQQSGYRRSRDAGAGFAALCGFD
jgi:hypothetical protein